MSGLYLPHIKHLVIAPALDAIGLSSPAAINLVAGTALVESGGAYLHQLDGGPALGLFELEPETLNDVYYRWLALPEQSAVQRAVRGLIPATPNVAELAVCDLRFGAIMCRLRYRMSPLTLPAADDAGGLAAYHKAVYNTKSGAADATRNTPLFAQAIAA